MRRGPVLADLSAAPVIRWEDKTCSLLDEATGRVAGMTRAVCQPVGLESPPSSPPGFGPPVASSNSTPPLSEEGGTVVAPKRGTGFPSGGPQLRPSSLSGAGGVRASDPALPRAALLYPEEQAELEASRNLWSGLRPREEGQQ